MSLLTHVDGTWETLTLSQHRESIFQASDSVLVRLVVSLNWFVTL